MNTDKETANNLSEKQLKDRLISQGFSPFPMNNVQRPVNSISSGEPLVARMYSLSNNLVKEVKQPQTSILINNLSKFQNTNEAFLSETNKKRSKTLVPVMRPTMLGSVPVISQTEKGGEGIQSGQGSINTNTGGQSQLVNSRPVPGSIIRQEEKEQITNVVNTLRSGHLNKIKFYINEPEVELESASNSQNITGTFKMSKQESVNIKAQHIKSFSIQRKGQAELDLFINLLTKNSSKVDDFVYLVRNPDSDDPYDLLIKSYFDLQPNSKKKQVGKLGTTGRGKPSQTKEINEEEKLLDYYTISIKGVSRFVKGNATEFISLSDWIKERETYDKIKQLSFFANFRRWKTLKIWSKNYKSFKQRVAKKNLETKHFINCTEIREAILQSRDVFYNMSQLKFIDFSIIRESQTEICNIIKFVEIQEHKAQQTQAMIQSFSKEIHQVLEHSFESRLEILRNQISHTNEVENIKKTNTVLKSNQIFNSIKNPYEAIGFPENMSYDKRSMLRKECHRFVRFAFFIDFLAQDTLRCIYLRSLKLLKDEVYDLSLQTAPNILRDLDKNKSSTLKEPFFALEVDFNLDFDSKELQKALEIEQIEVEDYKFPQVNEEELRPEEYEGYSLITYPFIVDYNIVEDFNEHQKKFMEYCSPRTYYKNSIANIEKVSLSLVPSMKDFKKKVFELFENGLNSLQAFTSFMADKGMKKYFAVLDEWEEREEGKNSDFDSNLLNPEDCIDQEEKRTLELSIFTIFKDQLSRATEFLSHFHDYLQMSWEYSRIDYQILGDKNLAKPAMTLNAVINLLDFQKSIFESQIAFQTDLGIFRISSFGLKKHLLQLPGNTKDKILSTVLESLYSRIDICRDWFMENIKRLELSATDIDVFVVQTKNLKDIEKKIGYYRDMLRVIKEMIEVIKKYQIDFKKSYVTIFVECKNLENTLVNQILQISDNLAKNQEIFSKEIRDISIPNLIKECTQVLDKLNDPKFLDIKYLSALQELKGLEAKIQSFKERSKKLNSFEDVLELNRSRFEIISVLNDVYSTKILLWESYEEWFQVVQNWRDSPFKEINVEEIQAVVEKYQRNILKIRNKVPPRNEILMQVENDVKSFASMLPIVVALRNPKLQKSHFTDIEAEIDTPLNFDQLTLKDLLNEQVLEHQNQIMAISVQVTQEFGLKQQLNEIDQRFGDLVFPLKAFKEDSPKDSTYILGDVEPIMSEIDRLIMMINNVYGSRYLKEFKKQASDKRKDILILQELLIEWIKFQKNYIYLESIFSQSEIKRPLQLEVKEFDDSVNKVYKQNMKKIMAIQSIALLTKQKYIEQYVTNFRKQNDILHELNKKLNNFLDSKREAFPRFYFVANDELVLILANYDSVPYVQTFIGKLFENVHRADFGNDPRSISIQGLISREGEVLPLKSVIGIKSDSVEKWLKKVEDQMFESLHKTIKDGLKSFSEFARGDWYLRTPSQALSIISQIAWTINVEEVLRSFEKEDEDALEITDVISDSQKNLEILIGLVRRQLSVSQHQSIVATITAEVHNRDVLEMLSEKNVTSLTDFNWQQQLRFYYDDACDWKQSISISQITSMQKYGYEYYGPASRIVITPLTERCWITVTSALQMKLGAAPAGPAGTGKTESVKDLAKSFARFCVVFNCSDQIDYVTMEKLFRGIIKQGAWTCLDEFNRIDIEVLSVVAQQLLEMRLAMLTHQNEEEFFFCGSKCRLNDTCGVFITMNPGYAGRTELPENLKALFRPISMMIPDYTLISQILLFSEGFLESKILASKMVKLYKLASEQLSQQKHYDFGMRAVKTVLEMAGRLKRQQPEESESVLLIKALKDANIPKFVKEDLPLFNCLLSDLFPGVVIKEESSREVIEQCKAILKGQSLMDSPDFLEKIKQFQSTIKVRFGTMVVGTAMCGKSTLIKTLSRAFNDIVSKVDEGESPPQGIYPNSLVSFNPKSVSMGELFGEENPVTKDWADGLASFYIRQAILDSSSTQKWICFDGPVDPLWIENMNSVLDDSKLLCLANGQRIRLKNEMRILFEVDTLENASPATVSRCGMVLLTSECIGWRALTHTWVQKMKTRQTIEKVPFFEDELVAIIESYFVNCFDGLVEIFNNSIKYIDSVSFQSVRTVLDLLDIFFTEEFGYKPSGDNEYKSKYSLVCFVFATSWGFGGGLNEEGVRQVDLFLKKKFALFNFPSNGVMDSYINVETSELTPIGESIPALNIESNTSFFDILVPTTDTTKITRVMQLLLRAQKHVFLTGLSGTGKSVVVSNTIKQMTATQSFDYFKYNFSAQTNSRSLQDSLLSSLFLLSQKSRGARFGRKNLICIDDVNMPTREQFGAQPPVELLRQILDNECVFDRKEMYPLSIQDSAFICLGAPAEGGRNPLSPRFVRHFRMLSMPRASKETIFKIFSNILGNFLFEFDDSVKAMSHAIVNASNEFYERIIKERLPSPSKFFYTFNLRDLSKTFMGIMQTSKVITREPKQLVKLWAHEIQRVFGDRLNSQEDIQWMHQNLGSISGSYLYNKADSSCFPTLMFTDLFSMNEEELFYEEVVEETRILKALEQSLEEYNDSHSAKLKIVFFKEAVMHILRCFRVLRQSRGSSMLIGLGGLGKTTVAKFASHLATYPLITLDDAKGLGGEKLKEWLRKKVLLACAGPESGIEGTPLTLIVCESSVEDENLYEDINSLLNTGEVPNIFPKDEREKLEKGLLDLYSEEGMTIDPSDVWKIFTTRVRENIHIIMSMSPIGDGLRIRCRKFPALIDCCTIDWFDQWSGVAIKSVARRLLEEEDIDDIESICNLFCDFHQLSTSLSHQFVSQTKRKYFVTPKSTLDNIELFSCLLKEKRKESVNARGILHKGSEKLLETGVVVEQLKKTLIEAQPLLEEQCRLTEEKLLQLESASKIANEKREKVEAETSVIQLKTEQIELINNQASSQLAESLPKIQKAENEVRNIDKKELNTLRHLNSPPAMIEFIFSTVCIALDEKYVNWKATGMKMLTDLPKFVEMLVDKIDKIKTLGSSVISSQSLNGLARNLKNEFFSDAKLESNIIAKPLGLWCKAIFDFANLKKQIEPLEKNAREMNEKLAESKKEYDLMAAELAMCRETFQALQTDFNKLEEKKKALETNIGVSKIKLQRAEKLTTLLADEGVRWKETFEDLNVKAESIVGDTFLSSAYISYMGPLTLTYRSELLAQWKTSVQEFCKISDNYSFLGSMGDSLVLKDWCMNGLPSDEVSQSSALLSTLSQKWPLMIDPQMQANIWVRNSFQDNLIVLKSEKDKKRLFEKIKMAVTNGMTILFEDVDTTVDPLVDPILSRQQFINQDDKRTLIAFGTEIVEYHRDTRLVLTCKLSNPSFFPEIFIKANVINFTVNQKGLEDQLLAEVMKLENPQVESSKNENIEKLSDYKKKMSELEKEILKLLVECKSSPVEDESLVKALEVSKQTSNEINVKLKNIETLFVQIEETRNSYRAIAERGSILFFVISDIANIDPMYQYSLQYIIKLFKQAIVLTAVPAKEDRRPAISNNITENIFRNVSRGLFEKHKPIFSFLIAVRLNVNGGEVDFRIWDFFLKGVGVRDRRSQKTNPSPTQVTESNWDLIQTLSEVFPRWQPFYNSGEEISSVIKYTSEYNVFTANAPGCLGSDFDIFDKLMLVKIFRPDLLFQSIIQYVERKLGKFYVTNIEESSEEIYKSSDCFTPIIFIISQGSDPSSIIQDLGEKRDFKIYQKLLPISLGQGQGKRAAGLIAKGREEGLWILLENCHLAKTWMPELDKIIQELQTAKQEINPDFRLFLTSMPASYFPISILQNGIKVTTEAPRGIKANLSRSVHGIRDNFFDSFNFRSAACKITLALCLFHAIVQERKKFGALGWNIKYEFNDSDLEAGKTIIETYMASVTKKEDIPWHSINFLTGSITYGGRITDDLDRRLLNTIISKFYTESILDDRYKFTVLDDYRLPKVTEKNHCVEFAQGLPGFDDPEIFGLNRNANVSFQTEESAQLLNTIVAIMPKDSASQVNEKAVTEALKEKINLFLDPEHGLPPTMNVDEGNKDLFKLESNGLIPILSIVLFQEANKFNTLLTCIESSLKELRLAVEGKTVMSAELDKLLTDLNNNQVPRMWSEKAYPSLKSLPSWLNDLKKRVLFVKNWLAVGRPAHYWISGLFFPQGFLTGVLQTHARKNMMPIDKYQFTFKITEFDFGSCIVPPDEGVYISGLFLEGASLDKKRKVIIDQAPNELFFTMPIIHFIPREFNDLRGAYYQCPLYKTLQRAGTLSTTGQSTNYIFDVNIPCDKTPDFWITRGVALFTMLND